MTKYSVSCSKRSTQSIASFAFNENVQRGLKNVIKDLHHLGLGISDTELMFIKDKWAERNVNKSRTCPSNTRTGFTAANVFDNIDWKNKNMDHQESHYTNSILVQKYDLAEELS